MGIWMGPMSALCVFFLVVLPGPPAHMPAPCLDMNYQSNFLLLVLRAFSIKNHQIGGSFLYLMVGGMICLNFVATFLVNYCEKLFRSMHAQTFVD